jgi:predicted ATP-binding protein involved in virulence
MLKKIKILGLFGKFDYDIELKEEGLTILTGPNGYGKTTILKIIHAVTSNSMAPFFSFSFNEIHLTMDNGEVKNKKKELSLSKNYEIKIVSVNDDLQVQLNNEKPVLHRKKHLLKQIIEGSHNRMMRYRPVDEKHLLDRETGTIFLVENLIEQLISENSLEMEGLKLFPNSVSLSSNTYFIREQRLVKYSNLVKKSRRPYHDEDNFREVVSVIEDYAREMSEKIEKTMAKASQVGQELDSSFPRRLFEEKGAIEESEFDERYRAIKEKQSALTLYGLSNTEEENRTSFSPENAKALLVYLNDMEKKLAVFDDILSKIKAFSSILNDRNFVFKQIEISAEHGFIFKTDEGKKLSLSSLSSGEQQQTVLLYELLFRVPENALVLIDEPEISLHVAWQKEIINDLLEIIRLKKINVITATHSPQVIGEHWDLVVDLWKISQ